MAGIMAADGADNVPHGHARTALAGYMDSVDGLRSGEAMLALPEEDYSLVDALVRRVEAGAGTGRPERLDATTAAYVDQWRSGHLSPAGGPSGASWT